MDSHGDKCPRDYSRFCIFQVYFSFFQDLLPNTFWKAFSHKLGTGKWVGGPWLTRGSWET